LIWFQNNNINNPLETNTSENISQLILIANLKAIIMKLASKSFGVMQNGNINKKIMMLIIKNSFQFYHSKIYTPFFSLMQLVTILPFEGIIICVWMWQHRMPFRDFV